DITEQKELELELVEAREAAEQSASSKEIFLANMSHEIRTPMNAILGMGRQLNKTELNEQQHFFLNTINTAAEHLLVIINDILDISKIEAGKLQLEEIGFNLADLLQHSQEVITHKAEEKGLSVSMETDRKIDSILIGDPYRLNQVMLNLLSNAVKFTEKGRIEVKAKLLVSKEGVQLITVTVSDTGIGMDKEFLASIFQKFSQEDKTITRKYGGTGLGMSISKQLVELMQGTITVSSSKGVGTKITLTIPFKVGTVRDLKIKEKVSFDSSVLRDKKILLVEDNEMNRLVAITVLKNYGVHISEVVNGAEAVEAVKSFSYDLVLMDVQMPVMDGIQATRIIRSGLDKYIPIIALTANAIKGESDRCLEAGMSDYVSKPFEEEDLVTTIAKWFGKSVKTKQKGNVGKEAAVSVPLYDLSKLEKIANGNKEFVNKMIRLFCDQLPEAVSEIKNAYSKNDFSTIKSVAHRIKPGIDNMGITSLHQEIREIEVLALTNEKSGQMSSLIKKLETTIKKVVKNLDTEPLTSTAN
ncbi:MAG: response regulator, partial [Bacteroidetes bacterium]|nr:response regulator [Bacteroidota bacterium]